MSVDPDKILLEKLNNALVKAEEYIDYYIGLNEKEFLNSFIFTLQLILQNTKKEDLPFS